MHNGRNVGGAYRRHAGEADENHEESLHVSTYLKKKIQLFEHLYEMYLLCILIILV